MDTESSYWWLWLLLFLLLLALAGAVVYYWFVSKKRKPAPIPLVEEKPVASTQPQKTEQKPPERIPDDEHKERNTNRRPIGSTCHNGHPLFLSNSAEGCPGGYYICSNCEKVFKCNSGHWVCGECPISYCLGCKTPNEEELRELAARRPSNENSQDKSENPRDSYKNSDYPRRQGEYGENQEDAKYPRGTESMDIFSGVILDMVKQVISSDQVDRVPEYREVNASGKATWVRTHFIFLIDSSESMKGSRWESVKIGFKDCLTRLIPMQDILVTALTFDNKPKLFCKEKSPLEAIDVSQDMPFTGEGTNYKRALTFAVDVIKKSTFEDYLVCIVFLSDGLGGYPVNVISELKEMIEKDGSV